MIPFLKPFSLFPFSLHDLHHKFITAPIKVVPWTHCVTQKISSFFFFFCPWWLATQVHNCTHQISVVNWTPSVKHNFFLLLCSGTSCSSWISAIGSSHKPYVLLLWRWFHVSEIRILQYQSLWIFFPVNILVVYLPSSFFFAGMYYHISKRASGIRYVFIGKPSNQRPRYGVLYFLLTSNHNFNLPLCVCLFTPPHF